ncbi:hypothetical protein BDD14_6592 [Edaphobacter modestus]|uniref:Uncharacterized protein n=1 Tax=Edaphobacter modestus TaxID=388466 RepID=A0A4Q7XYI4_9BACT|nr:hypothetical protein BDD14_6592 [Edaphobacter modestus]
MTMPEQITPTGDMTVQTENLCAIFGGCAKCPGHAKAIDCGLVHLNPDALVFCIHGCHQLRVREKA